MALDLTRKKACSSTTILHVTFLLLTFITLMASFTWLQNHLQYTPQDQDHLTKSMLEIVPDPNSHSPTAAGIICDRTHNFYDLCSINGPTVLEPGMATLYTIGPTSNSEKVKPYPRKWQISTMSKIRDVELKTGPTGPKCEVHHNSPALVFSTGGLTGNFFHDFNEGLLPLYVTLTNLSMVDRDVILIVDNARDWWVRKYASVINAFTRHPIINLENENSTHCFSRAYVGLISHWHITVNQIVLPIPLTFSRFHSFIRNALDSHVAGRPTGRRPKLLWLVRVGSVGRVILNQEKARAAAEELGFEVIMYHPTKSFLLHEAYKLIKESHAMIGVHGAAMTHVLLLRKGTVVVQVVPLGLELVGRVCYGQVARDVGLEYMEYKIGYNESSLSRKYETENPILKNSVVAEKGWPAPEFMKVYLEEQDVMLDLVKFKLYMEKVYKKAKHFMDKNS